MISINISFFLYRDRDAGLYGFITDYLALRSTPDELELSVTVTHNIDEATMQVAVSTADQEFTGLKADQIFKKFQTSRIIFFHSSTAPDPRLIFGRPYVDVLHDILHEYSDQIESMKKMGNQGLSKIAKEEQKQLSELLGRLGEKI
jgi:hypothetical protein